MKLADYLLENPLYGYGKQVSAQGMQTTPVQSWQEGLARALQGGVGGFFEGQGLREAKAERSADATALGEFLAKAGNDDMAGARAAIANRPNLADFGAQIGMQDVMFNKQIRLKVKEKEIEEAAAQRRLKMYGIEPPTTGGGGDYESRVARLESGNNPLAVNPDGGAGGAYQFMPGTWSSLRASNPTLNLPEAVQQATPEQQRAAFGAFTNANRSHLQSNGVPVNNATLYLAHWFGPQGAMNLLRADPNAPIEQFLPSGTTPTGKTWAQANGIQGKTVGDVLNIVSQRMGAAPQSQPAPQQQGGGDTIMFHGVPVPKAAFAAAIASPDWQKQLVGVVSDAIKRQQEGVPIERIRMPDGTERLVPRAQAAGMTSAQNVPPPGDTQGDVDLLTRALQDPNMRRDPAVKAAYDRLAKPTMSQSGQLMYPDMSAWNGLGFGQGQSGPRFEDTPSSRFQMSGKLADDFNQLKPVKDYREVLPIYQSMQEAAGRNNRVADLNLVYGLAKIFDPTSVVREGEQIMVRNAQSLPDWVRGMINTVNGGSQFIPEQRARIMQEASSRVSAYKAQHDAVAQQFSDRGQRYGLDPRDIITAPKPVEQPSQGPANGPVYDINGKRVR